MRKFVLIGTGSRSGMYLEALAGNFKDAGTIAALCDTNHSRMNFWVELLSQKYGLDKVPTYHASEFDRMIDEIKPDVVIVTTVDRTHHKYICRALELGCDVITEKPMTTDAVKCQGIIDTVKRTGRHLTVAFNYRYSPRNTKIKELLKSGIVGNVTSVHFEWLLNTSHGADYFRRWHRDKNNSGGLLVHKSTHHFDLMNWWLDSEPETVFAMGSLRFYGRENAENRGVTEFYDRARYSEIAAKDPFALHVTAEDERLQKLYYDAEHEDGYYRDRSVFNDGINIEDNMVLSVKYRNGAIMAEADMKKGITEKLDYVGGVPDTGTPHAIGYANRSGAHFARPFIKYTPTWSRSFIPANQADRKKVAKMKQIPVHDLIKDKNLLFVDDSIVRGTQLKETVDFLYDNGAKAVHMRSACPPIMYSCKYLNFSRSTNQMELIARRVIVELEGEEGFKYIEEYSDSSTERGQKLRRAISEKFHFASLEFQSLEGIIKAIGIEPCKLCTYCWNGKE